MPDRERAFHAVFNPPKPGRALVQGDPKYPSRCCMSHPEIGYFGNEWPGNGERCPVCRLLDHIAAEQRRADA